MTDEAFEEQDVATVSPLEGYFITLQHLDRLGGLLSEVDISSNKWQARFQ